MSIITTVKLLCGPPHPLVLNFLYMSLFFSCRPKVTIQQDKISYNIGFQHRITNTLEWIGCLNIGAMTSLLQLDYYKHYSEYSYKGVTLNFTSPKNCNIGVYYLIFKFHNDLLVQNAG